MEEKAAEKEAFFKELYQLDEDDSEDEESSEAALILQQSPRSVLRTSRLVPIPRQGHIHLGRLNVSLGRTVSAPQASTPKVGGINLGHNPVSSPIMKPILTLERAATSIENGTVSRKPMPKPCKKRKRGQSLDMLPESQQFFKGLSFYFFPNNDIAHPRAIRIRKAMEWGAVWVKDWRDGVTHVISDKTLTYRDLLSFLKISTLPPGVVLVNESYPADCFMYRCVLNPNQRQYQVEGHQQTLTTDRPSTPASSAVSSMPLKPEKVVPQTPSRTEGSGPNSMLREMEAEALERDRAHEAAMTESFRLTGRPRDALDEAMDEAMATKDLPMRFDDDESLSQSTIEPESEDEHSDQEAKKINTKKASSKKPWQENFSCMQKHDGKDKAENPNARTIEVLQEMANYYDRTNDHWRTTAYRRAITALRKESHRIMTKEEALAIPFIGERLALKIEEIVWTNRLRRLDNTSLEPSDEALQTFMNIYGVGLAQASKWVSQGHRTLEDLTTKANVTKNQQVGIAHYSDFLTRIPRDEVTRHSKLVKNTFEKCDSEIQVTVGGSYRRGAPTSGDIDFIITKPDCPIHILRTLVFSDAIPRLFAGNYLKVALATTLSGNGSKWHGAACLPGSTIWRRIDFLLVPWEELGAALIYFTGNDIFNRSIRLLASKKGMRLNQRGLWKDVIRGPKRERITQGTLVEGKSEKEIFMVLGVPWRPPEHRIC